MTTEPNRAGLAQPGRRRGLRALVAAQGVSSAGDGVFLAAAPLAAAAITRDPAAVAAVTAAEYAPWVVIAPLAGVYVDRWPKRTTMIVADLVRAAAVAVLAGLVALGSVSVAAIAVCAFIMVAGVAFHSAAAEAVVADLATEPDELHRTNGHLQSSYNAGRQLLGPPAGSLAFSTAPWLPFAGDAVSFAASAVLLRAVPSEAATRQPQGPHQSVWSALRAGAAYLAGHAQLRALAILTAVANLSANMVMGILVLFATDRAGLGISTAGYGLLLVALAVGGIAGGAVVSRIIRRWGPRTTMVAGLAAQGLSWLVLAATSSPVAAGAALAVAFAGVSVVSVCVVSARQTHTPPELLGRVISAFRVVGNGTSPIGALLGGLIAAEWGLRAPLVAAAVVAVAALTCVWTLRSLRQR
ncbi:MFS transporter [Micromonospora lupini]|uniref:MFS transporter n=1 Tax=Micromonospora lupini TaxID=285679 RepID=UPI0022510E26|nr:MFS transporter [Micromonospora lupini]MCX5070853.1 MFS transporter [Micromonospora lupini]